MKIIRLLAVLVALLLAAPAAAQFERPGDDDPAIAAQRQKVFDAPYDDKAIHSEKLLELIAGRFGEDSKEYLQELQLHAQNLYSSGKSPEAQRILQHVVALAEKIHGPDSTEFAFANDSYATALQMNGFKAQAEAPYAVFIKIMTDVAYGCGRVEGRWVMGCSHDEGSLGTFLLRYGQLLDDLGRPEEGVAAFEQTIARFTPRWEGCETAQWGTKCDRAAEKRREFLGEYARFLKIIGKNDSAMAVYSEILMPRLEAIAECVDPDCEPDYALASDFGNYRRFLADTGMFAAARDFDDRWLPTLAALPAYARGGADDADYFDKQYRESMDYMLADYAEKATEAGDRDRALVLLEPLGLSGLVTERVVNSDLDGQIKQRKDAILALDSFGDYARKARMREELAPLIAERYGEQSTEHADAIRDIGLELRFTQTPARAEDYFRRSLAMHRAVSGDGDFRTWYALGYLKDYLKSQGRAAEAIPLMREVLDKPANDKMPIYSDPVRAAGLGGSFGDPYDELNKLKADLAELLLQEGEGLDVALTSARHAATGLRTYRDALGFGRRDENALAFANSDPWAFLGERRYRDYFVLLADALWEQPDGGAAGRDEAFVALQEAMMGTTSRAVAVAAAERAAARGGVAGLLDERDALDLELKRLEDEYFGNVDESSAAGRRQRVNQRVMEQTKDQLVAQNADLDELTPAANRQGDQALWDEIRRKEFRRAEINDAIARAAPGYFELVRPRPLALGEAQAMLGEDEAFLMVVPSPRGVHALLLTRRGIDWKRSDVGETALNQHVRRLLWDVGASIEVSEEEDAKWKLEGEGDFPFDRKTAHLLYTELVAPFAGQLEGKRHLFVAATGAISSLPLSVLVTEPPEGEDGDPAVLRATPWLGDRVSLVQLPSLQSLQLLRAVEAGGGGGPDSLMIGFGDPLVEGEAATRGTSARERFTRAPGAAAASVWRTDENGLRLADPTELRKLARLPGTERELLAMQKVFGEKRTRLYLAERATETNVKAADLSDLSVLFLATHGLVAGELEGKLVEPGLLFTPPAAATIDDDGLLTASEITAMRMGVEWVILSACNTAAGDGSEGAPGLSGLARSFFFAGAESLLASHWPVRDDVASVMTVRLFELRRDHPQWSRAEALQAAMKEIRNDDQVDSFYDSWAHPSAWAPFTYIGDVRP